MRTDLWDKLQGTPLLLDQTSHTLDIEPEELALFYEPLANNLIKHCGENGRKIISVSGPPGCGKSAFAAILGAVINAISDQEFAIAVGLDGWHYSNAYLDSHWITNEDGQVPLRQVKGAPESFDTGSIMTFLGQVGSLPELSFPVYSRAVHDPIANAGMIKHGHRFVMIEGNYWLLDMLPWKTFQKYFDLSIFLSAKPETLIEGLRERHLRGGKSADWVAEHMRKVDCPNMALVINHSSPADVVIYKKNNRSIERLVWREGHSWQ